MSRSSPKKHRSGSHKTTRIFHPVEFESREQREELRAFAKKTCGLGLGPWLRMLALKAVKEGGR